MPISKTEDVSYRILFDGEHEEHDIESTTSPATRVGSIESFGKTFHISPQSDALPYIETRRSKTEGLLTWIRWSLIVILQIFILVFLARPSPEKGDNCILSGREGSVETGDDINGLYKTLSHTYTFLKPEEQKYVPNMTSNDNRMEVRRNWDLLMPLGSGSVLIPDYKEHPLLGDPITDDPIRSGPIFEASWTHALHCLYYTVDSYHQLILNGPSDEDNPYHAAHCFEYLRNNILCNLDMTLEGSMSTPSDKERGQPHVCRNRAEAIEWIEKRRTDDFQDIVGP
ncbi:conserved hypothetical protein [Talaromyces stipitatus ATCC 10500]|uniref:Oxidase ustYa n=1 Tax=Talaromyces stipitatus (strain ATCC 10500 / CBS 375.48 / QM 6759 / NRRL 1006) TaxID=441959 RepID=B8MG17_TALSN|nr:uncharacterized protein TSTA_010020 [Talaromyces stipitatus ATCC 10500]EED15884.1 conserved hypothetical protein [Talaromyces stipitatus ATCC 10500]